MWGTSAQAFILTILGLVGIIILHIITEGWIVAANYTVIAFWFLCSLVAALYGTIDGIVAVILSTLVYSLLFWVYDYMALETLIGMPLLWLLSAFVFGEIRAQQNFKEEELLKDQANLSKSYAQLQHLHEESTEKIHSLENTVKNQENDIESVIEALINLVSLKPTQIILSLEAAIKNVIAPKKFSIYAVGMTGLEVVVSHGWTEDDTLPLKVPADTPLYEHVVKKREVLTDTNDFQRNILGGMAVLAAPLYDPDTGEVFGVLKIEEIGAKKLDFVTVAIIKGMSEFIGLTYAQARNYQQAMKENIFSKHGNLFSDAMYQAIRPFILQVAQSYNATLASFHIVLKMTGDSSFGREIRTVVEILRNVLPELSLLFQNKGLANEITILILGASPRQIEILEGQIYKALQETSGMPSYKVFITRKIEYHPET